MEAILIRKLAAGLTAVGLVACPIACSHEDDGPHDSIVSHSTNSDTDVIREKQNMAQLAQLGAHVSGGDKEPTKVVGPQLAGGPSPRAAAERFVKQHGASLRVQATDLAQTMSPDRQTPHQVPVYYDKAKGKYRFTRISYGQSRNGIPVYGVRVDVLVRNEPGNPVVWATSNAKSLGNYQPQFNGVRIDAKKARQALASGQKRADLTGRTRQTLGGKIDSLSSPEPVIWAGTRKSPASPRLAVTYVAEASQGPEKYRVVADAETGDLLHQESLVVFETVSGIVEGQATTNYRALECSSPNTAALPYPRLEHGGSSTLGDETGSYSFDETAGTPVSVSSPIAGEFFVVEDGGDPTRNEVLSQSVTPPAVADFLHNAEELDEYTLAQVNGYLHANQVRDWLLSYNPSFPTITTETEFPVNVNLASGYCPGNAWYDYQSINFCASSSTYGNTSFASVNYHEYGHHIVASAGSGQGEYGEGMSDVVAMLIADDPGLGYGFYLNECNTPLRSGDNDCQYDASSCSSCGSGSHSCGQLLSGIVWDIRNALVASEVPDYLGLLSNLAVNSTLLHTGESIDGQIAIDFLTLDDDDGNIGNGTPHREEICSGFEAHGIDCPELDTGLSVSPSTGFESQSEQEGGPFVPSEEVYTLENLGPDPLDFAVSADVSWVAADVTTGSLAVGETVSVTISIDEAVAGSLEVGEYTGTLTFDDVTGTGDDVALPLGLQVGTPSVQHSWDLDEDPGWERQGEWEFGLPLGNSGDPATAATGTNVFGYNLAGAYSNGLPETHLTSTAIDCSQISGTELRFQRWLGVESSSFDHASVRVSTDGETWSTVWENGGSNLQDTAWTPQVLDISAIADGQPTVYVRFTMGTTDGVVTYGGWNIDDIEIWGLGQPAEDCEVDAECDDGAFCNGVEQCIEGSCVPGEAVVCDDGVSCTDDVCDEELDACQSSPNHGLCDDGAFCNGAEVCTDSGCESGTPPVCDDGIDCTTDSCDVEFDTCIFEPDNTVCDNGVFCDGAEVCSSDSGCSAGTLPCPDGTCDEETNSCICEDVVYEAEDMYQSTGGPTTGGWNIWSNGYIETSHTFAGGQTTLVVAASGEEANGWPHMVVSVGGQVVGDVTVDQATWQNYEFTFDAVAGDQTVQVEFDNDYYGDLGDRNLLVDAVTVVCGGSEPSCDDGVQNGDETDVDCGGSCAGCEEGESCEVDTDCAEGICESGICTTDTLPSCDDGVQNGDETDVDCGGSCAGCEEGEGCEVDTDCATGTCDGGVCTESTGGIEASISIDTDWESGYCGTVEITNVSTTPTSSWEVSVDLNGANMTGGWNGNFETTPEGFDVTPIDWNAVIQPGAQMLQTGFCANRVASGTFPEVTEATGTF